MKEHWFELKLKDLPRTTTREQYKNVSRYLRTIRNVIEKEIRMEELKDNILKSMLGIQ